MRRPRLHRITNQPARNRSARARSGASVHFLIEIEGHRREHRVCDLRTQISAAGMVLTCPLPIALNADDNMRHGRPIESKLRTDEPASGAHGQLLRRRKRWLALSIAAPADAITGIGARIKSVPVMSRAGLRRAFADNVVERTRPGPHVAKSVVQADANNVIGHGASHRHIVA